MSALSSLNTIFEFISVTFFWWEVPVAASYTPIVHKVLRIMVFYARATMVSPYRQRRAPKRFSVSVRCSVATAEGYP